MDNTFYFLGFERFTLNDKELIKIFVLDLNTKTIHNIFKTCSKDLIVKYSNIKLFDNITNSITYAIKRNGVVCLDIK